MKHLDPTAIRQGDRLALSRALTAVENDEPGNQELQSALFPHGGQAHLVGITGAPGTGKSTLVYQLIKHFRSNQHNQEEQKVAVIAVDPTSPFSGGSLLGDRIRMQDLTKDRGVFIRSMASRGALGGLAYTTAAFAHLLDAAGYTLILIETVGAGQAEINIASLAHTVIVVDAPGLGDEIQAIKAGILEIADILVVNKSDLPGAKNTALALKTMLTVSGDQKSKSITKSKHAWESKPDTSNELHQNTEMNWSVPLLMISANQAEGIAELAQAIRSHYNYLKESGHWQAKEALRLEQNLIALLNDRVIREWYRSINQDKFNQILKEVSNRKRSPHEAVTLLLTLQRNHSILSE